MASRDKRKPRQAARKKPGSIAKASGPAKVVPFAAGLRETLMPGLRDRLIAILDDAQIAPDGRAAYLSSITGRAWQTTRRWISDEKPGLPDLMSAALLSLRFDIDANWLLGLSKAKLPLPARAPLITAEREAQAYGGDWQRMVSEQISRRAPGCVPFVMPGDEMEPRIQKGAPLLVDTSVTEIRGNGIYVLEYQGRVLVRIVENRIAEGLVLSCENTAYKETVLKSAQAAAKLGVRVLGKVELWLQLVSS
jgi:hypothetical protein